jgi:hypothetical protein
MDLVVGWKAGDVFVAEGEGSKGGCQGIVQEKVIDFDRCDKPNRGGRFK